jgi:transcriptional regulator with XRE-family HTH domain
MEFKVILPMLRQMKNVNQTTLAKAVGVEQYTISFWETGRSMPSAKQLIALADYFSVSVDALLGHKVKGGDSYDALREEIDHYFANPRLLDLLKDVEKIPSSRQEEYLSLMRLISQEFQGK